MTGLMILIVLLLICIVAWMFTMTLLYLSLVKGIRKYREAFNGAVLKVFEDMEQAEQKTDELIAKLDERVGELESHSDFATKTINQSRRIVRNAAAEMQRQLQAAAMNQGTKFVYKEPDEDPDEPRS